MPSDDHDYRELLTLDLKKLSINQNIDGPAGGLLVIKECNLHKMIRPLKPLPERLLRDNLALII